MMADAGFGKFKDVLLSIDRLLRRPFRSRADGYACRQARSNPNMSWPSGCLLIALGAGGIKPCVSTNVGDQFGESNRHLLTRVFNWFYFSINAGSAFSTLLIPWLLEPYPTDPEGLIAKLPPSMVTFLESPRLHSPDIAFGLPGVLMFVATVIFWMGRKKMVHIPPGGARNYAREILKARNGRSILVSVLDHLRVHR